ncbi:MAG TPA: hypothetical protein PK115_03235 [Bacteroidales bacterium]|nr:hypothetical protein [Bacteroidales bacterium]
MPLFKKTYSAIISTLLVMLFCAFLLLNNNRKKETEIFPLLIITDFGIDIDDAEAINWIASSKTINPVAIIHTGDPDKKRKSGLKEFLAISGIKSEVFYDNSPIDSLLKIYPGKLRIALLAQATCLSEYFNKEKQIAKNIHSIYIQASPKISSNGELIADSLSYNFRVDMESASNVLKASENIPLIFIGKYAAYEMRLTRDDFIKIASNGRAGAVMWNDAERGIKEFASRDSALFYKVFKIDSSLTLNKALKEQIYFSNPYDLLTVIAIEDPSYFNFTRTGRHLICGRNPETINIKNPLKLKRDLIERLGKQR